MTLVIKQSANVRVRDTAQHPQDLCAQTNIKGKLYNSLDWNYKCSILSKEQRYL